MKQLICVLVFVVPSIFCFGELGNYTQAAVSVDSKPCATIGKDVLERGGTAVDAAVAALFCNGVVQSSSMGLGGGLFMTIYIKETGEVVTLTARERAPLAATEDMFGDDPNLPLFGGLAIATPGQLKGLWEAKERYGNPEITWASLIQPSIDLCNFGIPITKTVGGDLLGKYSYIIKDPGMSEIFINPETNMPWFYDDVFTWPNLAKTLEKIAIGGQEEFYGGETLDLMLEDLASVGAILTREDFFQYETTWDPPVKVSLKQGLSLYSTPPPGSGALIAYVMNVLDHYDFTEDDLNDEALLLHRITEAFKWAFGHRSNLGDPFDSDIADAVFNLTQELTSEDFAMKTYLSINDTFTVNNATYYGADFSIPEDHGTSHLSVLAPNGDAVACTSTINRSFGAVVMSPRTGVIFNNEMDDFSSPNITNSFGVPPSPSNFIRPRKRPFSSTVPSLIIDDATGDVVMVSGASGGTKITTQTALVALRNLWLGEDIKEATDAVRIHHQLAPMNLMYNKGLSMETLNGLAERGHNVTLWGNSAAVNSIRRGADGRIYANADYRKEGWVDGF